MESIGVPYKSLGLQNNVLEYYVIPETDEEGKEVLKRVHLNPIPERLLRVLFFTTSTRNPRDEMPHQFLFFLEELEFLKGDRSDYPDYVESDRAAMCQIDANGDLREIPEDLEKALMYDEKYFQQAFSQKSIAAFYAPPRLRKILYHTAPPEERCYYLVGEEERKAALVIDYPQTNRMLRFRLLERFDENNQLLEISKELEQAILTGEVVDVDDLFEFDRSY
jgi:hypothetical protein